MTILGLLNEIKIYYFTHSNFVTSYEKCMKRIY